VRGVLQERAGVAPASNEGEIVLVIGKAGRRISQAEAMDHIAGLTTAPLDVANMRIETCVNGELRQSGTTASMAFPFQRIVEYVSTFCTLLPGDLISIGTPTGAGARLDPPQWLREGDVVEVTVEGVGTLRSTVIREAP
jgi:2-keto-4-pentenoate hydratase/2-oxohepta-3-ene-1,7-dioic acid hydratase in catechol pathway